MGLLIQKGETRVFDVKKEDDLLVDATTFHGDGEEEEVDIIGNGEEIVPEQSNPVENEDMADGDAVLPLTSNVGRARLRQGTNRVPIVSIPEILLLSGISDASITANVIRAKMLGGPLTRESEGMTDVEDTAEPPENHDIAGKRHKRIGGQVALEFTKQKSFFFGATFIIKGYGGVLGNSDGSFLCILFGSCGICDSNDAEVLASGKALKLSVTYHSCDLEGIIIESNSLNAIISINSNNECRSRHLQYVFNSIDSLRSRIPNLSLQHVLRECNQVADCLAKQGVTRDVDFFAWL
ncbi:hypothetical protein GH714_036103 [Hevea brasiliensis]|uniref:RNase H type-1 domain-containing protein n=1 Tax=Hevea brasiliensis TaxID=3981 RepID=A0A6A6KN27_HEVBR|nr:hypothetical protein GH714_036103 [Hevea brasiliensis]